jgi:hypothetical protein
MQLWGVSTGALSKASSRNKSVDLMMGPTFSSFSALVAANDDLF